MRTMRPQTTENGLVHLCSRMMIDSTMGRLITSIIGRTIRTDMS